MIRRAPVFVAVAAAAAAAATAGAATPPSGLFGTVRFWPTMPVCRVDVPCSKPAPGIVLTFRRGAVAVRTRTDRLGRYRVRLTPGTYAITTSATTFRIPPEPRTARVRQGRFTRVDVIVDTGIR